jgi:hypothetical protein
VFRTLLAALAATWVFYFEYIPPFRRVHIPFDLDGYHFPLFDYAFQALRAGRLPEWDPSMYSGMSYAGNVQTAFYYPLTWIMFAASWARERLSYQSVTDVTLGHVALAFTLCFLWLRARRLHQMAALLGAAVYAYGGHMCLQLQHYGLIVAYSWMPLGLYGIDRASEQRSVRPLWITAVSAAMAFLGGYPPTWFVFSVVAGVYALARPGRWRTAPGVVASFAFALAICAIQVLPAWETTQLREPEARYGLGVKDPEYFLSYVIPNYFDFGLDVPVETNLGKEYLYLGGPGIFGLLVAFLRRRLALPGLAVVSVCLLFLVNPGNVVWAVIQHSALLADLIRAAYFLAGISIGLTLLAARGLDTFLEGSSGAPWHWAVAAMAAWAASELWRWSGPGFAAGWWSALDALAAVAVFALGLSAYRARPSKWLAAALLLSVGIDYKVFGTSKRFNADEGSGPVYSSTEFFAMRPEAYQALRSAAPSRVLLAEFAPLPTVARHVGWRTPQGFDPLLSMQYRELGERYGAWSDDRNLLLDPLRADTMHLFGVRYVLTAERGPHYARMLDSPAFRMVGANDSYYKVFEFLDANSIYQFPGALDVREESPERRQVRVASEAGGLLTFAEQWHPGWSATLDGRAVKIEKWEGAFQAVRVPAGVHTIVFRYHEPHRDWGAAISLMSLALLAWWIAFSSKSTGSIRNPAAWE